MKITADAFFNHLDKHAAQPLIWICGADPFLCHQSAQQLSRGLKDKFAPCEHRIFHLDTDFDTDTFVSAQQNHSLFANHVLLELRTDAGKLPAALMEILLETRPATTPTDAADLQLLIVTPALEKTFLQTKLYQALEPHVCLVNIASPSATELPRWIAAQCKKKGFTITTDAADYLSQHLTGNFAVLTQMIETLCSLQKTTLSLDDVLPLLSDPSLAITLFDWINALPTASPARLQILFDTLVGQGTEPVLMLWGLAREIRQLASCCESGTQSAAIAKLPPAKKSWIQQQIAHHPPKYFHQMLADAARIDRMIKGASKQPVLAALLSLSLRLSGHELSCLHPNAPY